MKHAKILLLNIQLIDKNVIQLSGPYSVFTEKLKQIIRANIIH